MSWVMQKVLKQMSCGLGKCYIVDHTEMFVFSFGVEAPVQYLWWGWLRSTQSRKLQLTV